MRGLIQSLSPLKPKLILFSIDGPKTNKPNDVELVRRTQELVGEINWHAEIRTRFRESNLGLRRAVVDAVTWANSEYGQVIVLEDDVRAGPQLLDFLDQNLVIHKNNSRIAHVNGYNLVPTEYITHPGSTLRLSIYPESYAWATWERAWQAYDDDMTWAQSASLADLRDICGSKIGALRWKQNFADALAERIDTWAYRWLASMWEHRWLTVSPNRNISRYEGQFGGTHTLRKPKLIEPTIETLCLKDLRLDSLSQDSIGDNWLGHVVFRESYLGLAEGFASLFIRKILKWFSRNLPKSQKISFME